MTDSWFLNILNAILINGEEPEPHRFAEAETN
jgi:hypothetical protein